MLDGFTVYLKFRGQYTYLLSAALKLELLSGGAPMAMIRSARPLSFPLPTMRTTPNPAMPAPMPIVNCTARRSHRNGVALAPGETTSSGRSRSRY